MRSFAPLSAALVTGALLCAPTAAADPDDDPTPTDPGAPSSQEVGDALAKIVLAPADPAPEAVVTPSTPVVSAPTVDTVPPAPDTTTPAPQVDTTVPGLRADGSDAGDAQGPLSRSGGKRGDTTSTQGYWRASAFFSPATLAR